MSEKLDLNWHTFSDHLFDTSKNLYETMELADVTLVSDDQKHISAHKIFLSASSEIFRNILLSNTHKNPIIYLTNIKHHALEAIIQFIYLGKATFYQDKMNDFLSAAKSLQITEIASGFEIENGALSESDNQSLVNDAHMSETTNYLEWNVYPPTMFP